MPSSVPDLRDQDPVEDCLTCVVPDDHNRVGTRQLPAKRVHIAYGEPLGQLPPEHRLQVHCAQIAVDPRVKEIAYCRCLQGSEQPVILCLHMTLQRRIDPMGYPD